MKFYKFKNVKILLLALLLALLLVNCGGSDSAQSPGEGKETADKRIYKHLMYVSAGGGLRMREAPNTDAKRVITIPNGSEVVIKEERGSVLELAGKEGKWVRVLYKGQEGWVFGGFLSREAASLLSLPVKFQGRYIEELGSGSNRSCVSGTEMSLYITGDALWCVHGETGMSNYCKPSKINVNDDILSVTCDTSVNIEEVNKSLPSFSGQIGSSELPSAAKIKRISESDIKMIDSPCYTFGEPYIFYRYPSNPNICDLGVGENQP